MSSSTDKENNNAAPVSSEASDPNPVHKFKFPKLAPGATKERQVKSACCCFGFKNYCNLVFFKFLVGISLKNLLIKANSINN